MPGLTAAETSMFAEAREAGDAVRRLFAANRDLVGTLAERLRASPPSAVITCARGSSDNAATFARYLVESRIGAITGSLGLSVASIYRAPLMARGALAIGISQSGASPDLLAAMELAGTRGAATLAMVNAPDAPVAQLADHVVALSAGPERSVAATKSFIASLAAIAWLIAEWQGDRELLAAVEALPDRLDAAWTCDWSGADGVLTDASTMFVLGRGPGLAVAQEAALKLKETAQLHAEALSAAEVVHGPLALVREGFPILIFAQADAAYPTMMQTARELIDRGARVMLCGGALDGAIALPGIDAHPVIQPIVQIMAFYRFAAGLSVARGLDPDRPPHLQKVTRTL